MTTTTKKRQPKQQTQPTSGLPYLGTPSEPAPATPDMTTLGLALVRTVDTLDQDLVAGAYVLARAILVAGILARHSGRSAQSVAEEVDAIMPAVLGKPAGAGAFSGAAGGVS